MKKQTIIVILMLFISENISAQRHELGLRAGLPYMLGDIGNTSYMLQQPYIYILNSESSFLVNAYAGLIYRFNFNPYQTVRLNVGFVNVLFNDKYAQENYRFNRGLSSSNNAIEADLLFEYNFLPVNNEQKSLLSPYIFGGIGVGNYYNPQITFVNDFKRNSSGQILPPDSNGVYQYTSKPTTSYTRSTTMSVPFGIGLKYKFNYNWAVSGEFLFRPTFSDGIDSSTIDSKNVFYSYNGEIKQSGTDKSILQSDPYATEIKNNAEQYLKTRNYGNANSKDWINTMTLSLTYSFGRPPCYCDQ